MSALIQAVPYKRELLTNIHNYVKSRQAAQTETYTLALRQIEGISRP